MEYQFVRRAKSTGIEPFTTLTLPLHLRRRGRQRVTLDNGVEASLLLKRGTVLKHGDHLFSQDGVVVRVEAAREQLSRAVTADRLLFARACYHLGNRHMPLQITDAALIYPHDHVVDGMLRRLGLEVEALVAAFEPEAGAYAEGGGGAHVH